MCCRPASRLAIASLKGKLLTPFGHADRRDRFAGSRRGTALPSGYRSLPVLAVEAADVVGEGVWFQVRGVMAARFRVHGPLHQVLVVTFGEAADPGKVAGESGDTERDGGRLRSEEHTSELQSLRHL